MQRLHCLRFSIRITQTVLTQLIWALAAIGMTLNNKGRRCRRNNQTIPKVFRGFPVRVVTCSGATWL